MSFTIYGDSSFDEISIVDVLTKLIFDAESDLDETEFLVIRLLGQLDSSVVNASRRDVSEYIRSMGVDEMILVVERIKGLIEQQQELIAAGTFVSSRTLHR
ncbi:MAG: hypothetical protein ACI92E_002287 [Oceanicoccus sp.]|jgi:hypothetical protein